MSDSLTELAADLVRIDSRSAVSNLEIAERIEHALGGFEIERLDYRDPGGIAKRALVAHRGPPGGLAFSGHMDTVPDTGWQDDPWSGRIADGVLSGLGSTDMKGPLAACIIATRGLPARVPATLLITTDEETTKQGAALIASQSALVRHARPAAILIAEPTRLAPVRGHRSHIAFTAVATGVQAHSSTGRGHNANWDLIAFLADLRRVFDRLRQDASLQDAAYDPPFSDFNIVIDNHGAPINMTVPKATVRIKYRYSASIDPLPVLTAVREAAARSGLALDEAREGLPPELPATHPLIALAAELTGIAASTAAYGTDASQLQAIAPCVVMGPGDIAVAHTPNESVRLSELADAVPLYRRMAERVAA
jgi:acetylornithine deacetylase/succinyl-diaminopimelate desuccinylase-like protein